VKEKLYQIIFEVDTRLGKLFDVVILYAILASVAVVMLESVKSINSRYESILVTIEWFFTILFSIEYILRIYAARNPWKYIFSFYGIIDLLSTIPSYIGWFVKGPQHFIFLRAFRLMRVFRILKLSRYIKGSENLIGGLRASKNKIVVFMIAVVNVVIIVGSLMYFVESESSGFSSIPRSIYWAIVTITTVGYGDISPQTNLGQFLASLLMLIGYAIIAVPSGIVTSAVINYQREHDQMEHGNHPADDPKICDRCSAINKHYPANYCHVCGERLYD
jgi:voltage-gated potassium channel